MFNFEIKSERPVDDLRSPEQFSMEGCLNLVSEILKNAYASYVYALKFIKENADYYYNDIIKKIEKNEEYKDKTKELKKRLKQNKLLAEYLTAEEKQENEKAIKKCEKFIKSYEMNKEIHITKKDLMLEVDFLDACNEKINIEEFYRSRRFKRYILGYEIEGEDVIEQARKEAGWNEEEDSELVL